MNDFTDKVTELIKRIDAEENSNISSAGKIMFNSIINKKIVHVFATGHSHMFCEELFYRAGGLVQINPILIPELMQHEGAVSSTIKERESGRAQKIFKDLDIQDGDSFIIVSNSGINSVPVEMAQLVKENNIPLIVITSMDMTNKVNPRNKFNKKLYEFGDVVIDNKAPYGDGVIEKPYARVGAVSSIMGSYIAQRLVLEVVKQFEDCGKVPPIYLSANTPDGDEHNKELYEEYKKRIKCLY